MKNALQSHLAAYLVLVTGLLIATFMFMAFWPHREYQRLVILGVVLFYILWGSVTHVKTDHFSKKVLYEYVAVAALGGGLLFLITL